jgi:hypothetical protein
MKGRLINNGVQLLGVKKGKPKAYWFHIESLTSK